MNDVNSNNAGPLWTPHEMNELYRDVILDHFQNPRQHGTLPAADVTAEGKNPLCGDELTLHLKIDGQRVVDLRWNGRGCSISQASTSMLADVVRGKTLAEAQQMVNAVIQMMHDGTLPESLPMGDVEVLAGVRKFPVRIKCALLAWTTLQEGIKQHDGHHPHTQFTF